MVSEEEEAFDKAMQESRSNASSPDGSFSGSSFAGEGSVGMSMSMSISDTERNIGTFDLTNTLGMTDIIGNGNGNGNGIISMGGLDGDSISVVEGSGQGRRGGNSTQKELFSHTESEESKEKSVDTAKVAAIHLRKVLAQSIDLRSISNTLVAQGVADNCYATLSNPATEEPSNVRECSVCLSILNITSFHQMATELENLDTLFMLYRQRNDCFYPFLSIIVEMILSSEVAEEALERLLTKFKVLVVIFRALTTSGWTFHRRNTIFKCLGKLSTCPSFQASLEDMGSFAVGVLCRELHIRKKKARQNRREAGADGSSESAEDGT